MIEVRVSSGLRGSTKEISSDFCLEFKPNEISALVLWLTDIANSKVSKYLLFLTTLRNYVIHSTNFCEEAYYVLGTVK